MNVHYHTTHPTYCIESTSWGWALAPECVPEKVEVCSERVVADVWFAPNLDALLERLQELGVRGEELEEFKGRVAQAAR